MYLITVITAYYYVSILVPLLNQLWFYSYGVYAEFHYVECYYAECHYAECHYAECQYAECHHAECCDDINVHKLLTLKVAFKEIQS